jgi:hypothetical protein
LIKNICCSEIGHERYCFELLDLSVFKKYMAAQQKSTAMIQIVWKTNVEAILSILLYVFVCKNENVLRENSSKNQHKMALSVLL